MKGLILSDKYKAFLRHRAPVEFLEGTTAAGKTTVGLFKFMLEISELDDAQHIIAGLDLGTIEKNLIHKDLGILDLFGPLVEYNASGRGEHSLAHILYTTAKGVKLIYILGYADKKRWQKALGGQYGGLYIDEINIADIDFVREASMRSKYVMGTLNPDDPNLPVYGEYINHARPLDEWKHETPKEILEMLEKKTVKPDWVHWFFSFKDNKGMSLKDKQRIVNSVPRGTKLYKNKVLGLRGRATGLVFNLEDRSIITKKQAEGYTYLYFSSGLDTAYSQESADTFAFVFMGITSCRKAVVLDVEEYNNRDLIDPIAPSDMPGLYVDFLERNREVWGFARDNFIDSADQATITELRKYERLHGTVYSFVPAWKKMKVIDRINLTRGWMAQGDYLVVDTCVPHINELNTYSWKEDKHEPEDANDHTINAGQYAWIPYKEMIGAIENEVDREDAKGGA